MTAKDFFHMEVKPFFPQMRTEDYYIIQNVFIEKMKCFTQIKCKEQRKECAKRAWSIQYEVDPRTQGIEYDEFIEGSPEPKL